MCRFLPLILALAACSSPRAPEVFTLRIAVQGALDPLSPEPDASGWSTAAQNWVFQPLATIGSSGEMVPTLVDRIEAKGAHQLRMHLRPATFSDGAPLTFADVAGSLARYRLAARKEGDDLVVESNEGDLPIESMLARAPIAHRAGGPPSGTGPFEVVSQSPAQILLRRRVPRPGLLQQVALVSYASPRDAFAHTLKGDADMLPDVEPRFVEFFESVPKLRIIRAPGTHTEAANLNPRLPRADRVALARVLARNAVRQLAFGDECRLPNEEPEIEPLPSGRKLEILTVPQTERLALAIRRQLGARGGEVRTVEVKQLFGAMQKGAFDLAIGRPLMWPRSMPALNFRSGSPWNFTGYSDAAADAAFDERRWAAAQTALDGDPPAAFICTLDRIAVVDARIKNAALGAYDLLETLPEWEVAQ